MAEDSNPDVITSAGELAQFGRRSRIDSGLLLLFLASAAFCLGAFRVDFPLAERSSVDIVVVGERC